MPRSYSGSRSRSPSPTKRRRSPTPDKLSPFLIRVFVTKGKHTPLIDFDDGKIPHREEFHVYGWKTSTPSSLIALLYPTFPAPYRSPMARFSFRHVYVDASQRGLYRSKDMITFSGRDLMNTISPSSTSSSAPRDKARGMDMELDDAPSGSNGHADRNGGGRKISEKTLDGYGFITGDLLSVSLYVPEPKTSSHPASHSAPSGPGFGQGIRGAASRDIPAGRVSAPEGDWAKGEALPPRGGDRDRSRRDGGGGGYRGAPGPAGVQGMGIRGGARRSPSVERDRNGNGNGYGRRRSRSPDRRRP